MAFGIAAREPVEGASMKRTGRVAAFALSILAAAGCIVSSGGSTGSASETTSHDSTGADGGSRGTEPTSTADDTSTLDASSDGVPACEMCGGDVCVDLDASIDHCGSCDAPCPTGIACIQGVCACPEGTAACDGACVDVSADGDNCGGCGRSCDAGLVCNAGECSGDCGALTECGGGCVDTSVHPLHCGGCDAPCAGGQACVDGTCTCPGEAPSYAADVEPIFAASCTGAGCHGFPAAQEGLDLRAGEGYASLVGVSASQCGDRLRVDPGNPDGSYVVDKLEGLDLCFGTQMPKMGSLTAAEIDLVARWICHGAMP